MDRRVRDRVPALTWNPLRDEGAAFQLVLIAIGVGGLIVLGSWISTWVGIGVVAALLAAGSGLLLGRRRRRTAVVAGQRIMFVGEPSQQLLASLRALAVVSVVTDAAAVEDALREFPADEIVVLDPALADALRARFVLPVGLARAEGYLPETASR